MLSNPKNIVTTAVTIPEGLRVADTVAILAAKTKFPKSAFDAVLKDPKALGLPAYAKGNAEGYLFPSTYGFGPKEKPADMLKDMVDRWRQSAAENDLVKGAQAQGRTPGEIMTIASLIQAEGRGSDMPKVSRVIYNRLDGPGDQQGTNGLLQIDATVNYALDRKGVVAVTTEDTQVDSPYNTYLHPGLPPGPINSPGDAAIKAAAAPGGRRLVLLRDRQPAHGGDQVRQDLPGVPGLQGRVRAVLHDVQSLLRRTVDHAVRRPRGPDRALSVAGPPPRGVRRAGPGLDLRRRAGAGRRSGGLRGRAGRDLARALADDAPQA